MGLYMYSKEVKKHVKSGQQLSAFTNSELEQKLGLHNFLHRKKVLLAIMTRVQSCEDCAGSVRIHINKAYGSLYMQQKKLTYAFK